GERAQAIELAGDQGHPALGPTFGPAVALAIHSIVARTPAQLMAVQLEDLLGLEEQANLPGTMAEHPNWQRRMPGSLEELARHPLFGRLLTAVAAERPRVE